MRCQARRAGVGIALLVTMAIVTTGWAQGTEPERPGESRAGLAGLFGGGTFPGGYLKYTYEVSRQGASRAMRTTTEITPQADGTYSIVSASSETVPLDLVHIGFFGVPLPRIGLHVSENTSGTIDLSPLANITGAAIEPGKNYILPDGGRFQAGEVDTLAGIDIVYGTYTHADYTNVEIRLAFAVDLTLRSLMPFPAMMEFRYRATSTTQNQPLERFSSVTLTEFVYKP